MRLYGRVAKNSDLYVKRATLVALKEAAPVVALVPAAKIFPIQQPADVPRPHVNYGVPTTTPFTASCLDGSESIFAVHNWTETRGSGVDTVAGEDEAMLINAAIEAALDGATLELAPRGCPYPATAHYTCTGSQVIQDGSESDKFHGIVNFRVTISS